jgi:large subunit ribosomal protein L10
MRRAEKIENVEELRADLGRATLAVLAEYRGLTSGQLNRVRRVVREANGRCRVTKNTLAKRAVAESQWQPLTAMLQGPVAVILAFEDPVAVAKVTSKLSDDFPKLEIKGAVLDGAPMTAGGVKDLAALPPREVLLAQLLGLLQAPATQLLRTLNEPAARLARLVDAIGRRGAPAGAE